MLLGCGAENTHAVHPQHRVTATSRCGAIGASQSLSKPWGACTRHRGDRQAWGDGGIVLCRSGTSLVHRQPVPDVVHRDSRIASTCPFDWVTFRHALRPTLLPELPHSVNSPWPEVHRSPTTRPGFYDPLPLPSDSSTISLPLPSTVQTLDPDKVPVIPQRIPHYRSNLRYTRLTANRGNHRSITPTGGTRIARGSRKYRQPRKSNRNSRFNATVVFTQ